MLSTSTQYTVTDTYRKPYILTLLHDGDFCRITLNTRDRRVGYVNLHLADELTLMLADLHLDEKYRRRGLGKLCINLVKSIAAQLGVTSIRGWVVQRDLAATPYLLNWYAHHGFTVEPPLPTSLPNTTATIYFACSITEPT